MHSSKMIWILEDNEGCNEVYEEILGHRYTLRMFDSLSKIVETLKTVQSTDLPDIFLTDLRLGDGNFLMAINDDALKLILKVPFLVVSSIDDIDALRFCYEQGAMDYLVKPFNNTELLIKVERTLQKIERMQEQKILNPFELKKLGKKFNDLTLKESLIFSLFMNSVDSKVTRSEILDRVWEGVTVQNKTVDVHLHNLRKKISGQGMDIRSSSAGEWTLVGRPQHSIIG